MTIELWILLIIVAAVAAFFAGRASASKRAEIEALQAKAQELEADGYAAYVGEEDDGSALAATADPLADPFADPLA